MKTYQLLPFFLFFFLLVPLLPAPPAFAEDADGEKIPAKDDLFRGKKAGKILDEQKCKPGTPCPTAETSQEAGTSILGEQFYLRLSYGLVQGTYADSQENNEASHNAKIDKLKFSGTRTIIEAHPIVSRGKKHAYRSYVLLEHRKDKPKADFWKDRQSALVILGFVLPWFEIIAPVAGVHWEFNKVDIRAKDSPEVAKVGIRAVLLGVHFRQRLVSLSSTFSLYLDGRAHILNPSLPNNGTEFEGGLGTTWEFSKKFRTDLTLGMLKQNYSATQDAGQDDSKYIKIRSDYQAFFGILSIWL